MHFHLNGMNYQKKIEKKYVVYYVNLFFSSIKILLFFLFSSEIPSDVQRCCTRCYDKLIVQVRQRQTNPTIEEEEDDDESNMNQNSKHDDG